VHRYQRRDRLGPRPGKLTLLRRWPLQTAVDSGLEQFSTRNVHTITVGLWSVYP
jgi:hypothetical protein